MKLPHITSFVFVSLLLVAACKTETPQPTPEAPASNERFDKEANIIAATDPVEGKLYVLEGQEENAIMALGGQRNGDSIDVILTTPLNDTDKYVLGIEKKSLPEINIFMNLTDQLKNFANSRARAALLDSNRGEFLEMFEKKGVYYRVYKNAECKLVSMGFETKCYPEVTFGGLKGIPTGKFLRTKTYDKRNCVKGMDKFCVEVLKVVEEIRTFDNDKCDDPPLETLASDYDFVCPK